MPATVYLRAPASQALLQLVWSGEFAFASGGSLAAVGRLFGYTGGLITVSQRTAMGQADVVFCDLFIRLTQGGTTSTAEEDAIELTEGWREDLRSDGHPTHCCEKLLGGLVWWGGISTWPPRSGGGRA